MNNRMTVLHNQICCYKVQKNLSLMRINIIKNMAHDELYCIGRTAIYIKYIGK